MNTTTTFCLQLQHFPTTTTLCLALQPLPYNHNPLPPTTSFTTVAMIVSDRPVTVHYFSRLATANKNNKNINGNNKMFGVDWPFFFSLFIYSLLYFPIFDAFFNRLSLFIFFLYSLLYFPFFFFNRLSFVEKEKKKNRLIPFFHGGGGAYPITQISILNIFMSFDLFGNVYIHKNISYELRRIPTQTNKREMRKRKPLKKENKIRFPTLASRRLASAILFPGFWLLLIN